MKIAEMNRTIEEKILEVNAIHDEVGDNNPTPEQWTKVCDLNKEIEELEYKVKDAEAKHSELAVQRERNVGRLADIRRPRSPVPFGDDGAQTKAVRRDEPDTRSIGTRFVESPAFKDWLAAVSPSGFISTNQKLVSPPFEVKTLITSADGFAGALVQPTLYPGVAPLPFRPFTVRDLITTAQTRSDTIEYVRIASFTNAAATVAEATAISGASGTKPESAMALEKITAAVKTIAHWIPATTRSLSDAPQMRSLIDTFLREGIEEELEDQIINGGGTGEDFTGILNTSGTTAQAFDTNILTTTRKARTKVTTVGRARPTGWIMHPVDWEAFDLSTDNEARYFFGGPSILGSPRLWGLPVAETEAMPQGTTVVGDLREAILWDREQTSIQVSNQHADFFIRNMIAILAEARFAFGVRRPAALVEVDLAA